MPKVEPVIIDTETAAWGGASNVRIIFNPSEELVEELMEASDGEICDIGLEYGIPLTDFLEE